jgi:hypothetical protein
MMTVDIKDFLSQRAAQKFLSCHDGQTEQHPLLIIELRYGLRRSRHRGMVLVIG